MEKNNIPQDGPLLIIANHSASFLDAMIVGSYLDRPIHFYVRSDIFKLGIVRFFLNLLHMIPIYSKELGKGEMHRNEESFKRGEEVLSNNGALLIFPEGLSRIERNLMPFKKGVSRTILYTLRNHPDLQITVVPLGIHFNAHEFRSDLYLIAGEPFRITQFTFPITNTGSTLTQITDALFTVFEKVALYVENQKRYQFLDQVLYMNDNDRAKEYDINSFMVQRRICSWVDQLEDQDYSFKKNTLEEYKQELKELGLKDRSFSKSSFLRFNYFFLIASSPVCILGALSTWLPYFIGKFIAKKTVTRKDFYTSVLVSVCAVLYLLWFLFGLYLFLTYTGILGIIFWLLTPYMGWYSIQWVDTYKSYIADKRFSELDKKDVELVTRLRWMRSMVLLNEPKDVFLSDESTIS
ncbi:MAG: 1-acyl-sn-glycerol-3-phosphate acyltransferase [Chitinophagaceae bacterium]